MRRSETAARDLFPGLAPTPPDPARIAEAESRVAQAVESWERERARTRRAWLAYRDAAPPNMPLGMAWRAAAEDCGRAWEAVRRARTARRLAR